MRQEGEERSEEEGEKEEEAIAQQTRPPGGEDYETAAITGLSRDEEIVIQIEQREDRERGNDGETMKHLEKRGTGIGLMTNRSQRMRK